MPINPVLFQNEISKIPDIQKDYETICNHVCSNDQKASIFDMLPPLNRLTSVDNHKKKENKLENAGLIAMAAVNLPEDIRDLSDMTKQIKSALKGDNSFKQAYDYSKAQHPFSFFRGTLMRKLVHPDTSPFPKIAERMRNADTTLLDTDFARKFKQKYNINTNDIITKIKDIKSTCKNPVFVKAYKITGGNPFTELTVRALARTPKIGVLAYGAIETANCAGNISNGENPFKAVYNSTIDLTTSLIGMGFGGAFGAKHFGAAGSLLGMGIGTILGKLTANELKFSITCSIHQGNVQL